MTHEVELTWRDITWYIVSEANSGERDDHEVQRLQERPVLHFLKHDCRHSEEDQTADEDGENRWDYTHSREADLMFLKERKNRGL